MATESKLYRELAKDYSPKKADMNICKYIQELEERIQKLENKTTLYPVYNDDGTVSSTYESTGESIEAPKKRGRPPKTEE